MRAGDHVGAAGLLISPVAQLLGGLRPVASTGRAGFSPPAAAGTVTEPVSQFRPQTQLPGVTPQTFSDRRR